MGPYNPASGVSSPLFPDVVGFEDAYMNYYVAMERLTSQICTAFALALELPENWFDNKINGHRNCIRSM